jgi:hypothetical protein
VFDVANWIGRRLAVSQARVQFSARHSGEVYPTELAGDLDSLVLNI